MMHLQLQPGNLVTSEADTLIVNLLQGDILSGSIADKVDQALGGIITDLISNGDLTGKLGEVRVIYPHGKLTAKRIIMVGIGKADSIDLNSIRTASAYAIQYAHRHHAKQVAATIDYVELGAIDDLTAVTKAAVEGMLLAQHKYDAPQQDKKPAHMVEMITLMEADQDKATLIKKAADTAQKIVTAVKVSRDLVYAPPNVATPTYIADLAQEISDQVGLKLFVGGKRWAEEQGMGAFLAVAQGAHVPPQFIVMEHNGDKTDLPAIVLVGKGITFDSGGLSLKPTSSMVTMKADMGGCGAVLGAMMAIGALDLPHRIIGIMPCTENMPDGNAYRPSDVITASNGKTIEIINTDAEGRLALADALAYAGKKYDPSLVIDLATLTGTAQRAMGAGVGAALFSTDQTVTDALMTAGETVHERVWPFPLWDDYKKPIQSDVADLKNSGGAKGGLGTSALFLQAFTTYRWAHIDIGGQALTYKPRAAAWQKHGATGFGVRLLVEFLSNWSALE